VAEPTETTLEEEPQEPQEAEESSQELVTKRVLGKNVEMPAWMAELWDERERDFQKRFNEPSRREQQLQRQQADAANQHARQEPQASPDQDLEWYAKGPTKAMAEMREQLRQEALQAAQQATSHAEQQRQWWGRFWSTNEDLVGKEWAVRSVANDYFQELGALDETDCHERMAQLTRERLGQSDRPAQRQVRDERQSPSTPRRTTPRQEPQKTLISVIDDRRRARDKARLGIKDR
jgi:hypothetical protein